MKIELQRLVDSIWYTYGKYDMSITHDAIAFGEAVSELAKHFDIRTVVSYTDVEKQLKDERELNAEIKARFVKCNTCTDEMKDKCLMFSENLCEGERCEELVDLMALVDKREKENNEIHIVIQDGDNYDEVLGIITLVENTAEDFEKEFKKYKNLYPDSWYWEGFMDYLIDKNWHFDWESENVSDIEI